MILSDAYQSLNHNFKKKFVFRLGADSGFFSEYNNMVLGVLYCLQHKIKFELSSGFANFKYQYGWNDFFVPFCKEDNRWLHAYYNYRPHMQKGRRQAYTAKALKTLYRIDFLTQDLWNGFHERIFEKEIFDIPSLGIKGNLLTATQIVINQLLWKYNDEVAVKINDLHQQIQLPSAYIGMHIRAGDKVLEGVVLDHHTYIQTAEKKSSLRTAFILTDDYTVIENIGKDYPEWTIHSYCSKEERGFSNVAFIGSSAENKRNKLITLFASMDLLYQSELFIGTFNSNPGMFLGMRMGQEKCIGVDRNEWLIW